ncbi:MAG: hypothetical protein ABSC95_23510 [Acetobacteraceae bacterium]|jgi:hypothetical protein
MRLWFKSQTFRPVADTVPPGPNGLIEEYLGTAPNNLVFPGVSTCTTLSVLLANNTLVGAHLSALCTAADIATICAKMTELANGQGATKIAIIGVLRYVGGTNTRGGVAYTSTPQYTFPAKLTTFAGAFGLTAADVNYYDQAGGTDKHYQVRAVGGGNITAYYRDVGTVQVGGGTSSAPYVSTGIWSHLPLLSVLPG